MEPILLIRSEVQMIICIWPVRETR